MTDRLCFDSSASDFYSHRSYFLKVWGHSNTGLVKYSTATLDRHLEPAATKRSAFVSAPVTSRTGGVEIGDRSGREPDDGRGKNNAQQVYSADKPLVG